MVVKTPDKKPDQSIPFKPKPKIQPQKSKQVATPNSPNTPNPNQDQRKTLAHDKSKQLGTASTASTPNPNQDPTKTLTHEKSKQLGTASSPNPNQDPRKTLTHENKVQDHRNKEDSNKVLHPSKESRASLHFPVQNKLTPVSSAKSVNTIAPVPSVVRKPSETIKGKQHIGNVPHNPHQNEALKKRKQNVLHSKKAHHFASADSVTVSSSPFFSFSDNKSPKKDAVELTKKHPHHKLLHTCPKTLTKYNEVALVKEFLNFKKPYVVPRYGEIKKCPKGLEFLHYAEHLHLDLRRVSAQHGICYTTYSQFDMKNERKDDRLMSFGIETTTRCQVFCCQESRTFQLHFYDYKAAKVFTAVHYPSVLSCLTRYMLCCFCGSNACGNVMTVYDSADHKIGCIRQCGCCTKRLTMYMEKDIHFNATKIDPTYTAHEFFTDGRFEDARILKFDVFDSTNASFVRIEQHLHNSYLCKFIYLKTLEPVGYVRRGGSTKLQLDLWRDFQETEKALLIAGAVLMDHLIIGISIEGSYIDAEKAESITEPDKTVPLQRSELYKFFCFNRLRTILITVFLLLLIILITLLVLFYVL